MSRRSWILGVAACLLSAVPASGQQHTIARAQGILLGPLEFYFVPYGGLPIVSGMGGVQQAIGAHVIWPAASRVALSTRYEVRWTADGAFYDAGSLDLIGRIAGTDTAAVSITGGWARWAGTDYSTIGVRLAWPFVPVPAGTFPVVRAWFDIRYAGRTAAELYATEGTSWVAFMLTFVLPTRVGRH